MSTTKEETRPERPEVESSHAHAPRNLTFAENAILTVKVLAGFGLLGSILWGLNAWTSVR